MSDLWNQFTEKAKELAGGWPAYAALGSFLLYLLGYLTLRFHLDTLRVGMPTDTNVLDERYLFAGISFLVFSLSLIPIIILLVFC